MAHMSDPIRPATMAPRRPRGNARITTDADAHGEPSPATQENARRLQTLLASTGRVGLCVSGSIEGILTGVGVAYLAHAAHRPLALHVASRCQPTLGESLVDVCEDEPFARRVLAGFERATSAVDAKRVIYAAQDDSPMRAQAVFAYMRRGFDLARPLIHHQADPELSTVFKLAQSVSCECEHARQFIRFHKMPNGVYRARFEPRANVVPLILRHFVARFGAQAFVIHDPAHCIAGFWDGRQTQLVCTDGFTQQADNLGDDAYYQALWKRFYDSVAVEARTNHDLRRQLMPKRFWKNLPEMNPLIDSDPLLHTPEPDASGQTHKRRPQHTSGAPQNSKRLT